MPAVGIGTRVLSFDAWTLLVGFIVYGPKVPGGTWLALLFSPKKDGPLSPLKSGAAAVCVAK